MLKKNLVIFSTLALLYIILLVILSYINYKSSSFNIIGQIITIPAILFTIGCFIFSIVRAILKDKSYLVVLGINILTIIIMIIFTIIQS